MASTTMSRASALPTSTVTIGGVSMEVVKNFAIFIDTHRDQPHVGSFHPDIHRGTCKPTLVHLLESSNDFYLVHNETGGTLKLDEKHRFLDVDWWAGFLADWWAEHGELPVDKDGFMPTSHLRDPRKKTYFLRSFRQMVVINQMKGTTP